MSITTTGTIMDINRNCLEEDPCLFFSSGTVRRIVRIGKRITVGESEEKEKKKGFN